MFKLSDKVYTLMKWGIIILLPAIGIFYTSVAGIFGLPYADKVNDLIRAICMFLGTIFCISSAEYENNKNNYIPTQQTISDKISTSNFIQGGSNNDTSRTND